MIQPSRIFCKRKEMLKRWRKSRDLRRHGSHLHGPQYCPLALVDESGVPGVMTTKSKLSSRPPFFKGAASPRAAGGAGTSAHSQHSSCPHEPGSLQSIRSALSCWEQAHVIAQPSVCGSGGIGDAPSSGCWIGSAPIRPSVASAEILSNSSRFPFSSS